MQVYPIKVEQVTMDHRSGTKSYHLTIIEANNGHCVFINRWCKTGSFGQLDVKTFDSPAKARRAWASKETEKRNNGYSQKGPTRSVVAKDQSELVGAIGRNLFNKIGAAAVAYLDPFFDTTGMRELDPPEYDEETGKKLDTARKANIDQQLAEAKRIEEEKIVSIYENNPEYGRF